MITCPYHTSDKINELEAIQTKQTTLQPKPVPPAIQMPKILPNSQQNIPDRKCNVVFYGLAECPPNTPRATRSQSDLKNVLSAVPNIDSSAIKDLHRLGKYKPGQQRPRPLLVQFLRTLDASAVLSDRSKLSPPILAKPDMTPEERNTESLLLKARWNLIQQGFPRKTIKIRNAHIYLNNQPYGVVTNSKFNQLNQPVPPQGTSNTVHSESAQSMDTASDNAQ